MSIRDIDCVETEGKTEPKIRVALKALQMQRETCTTYPMAWYDVVRLLGIQTIYVP